MADGDILISIRGDASGLEAEITKAQTALSDLEDSASDTGDGLGGMGDAAGKANKAIAGMSSGGIRGLATGLRQVNPALGTALMTFAGLKKALPGLSAGTVTFGGAVRGLSVALKGLAAALGPIGIALIAGAAAYEAINFAASKYEKQLEELNKDLEESIKINNQLNAALSGLEEMERQVANEMALLRGDITETDLEIQKFNAQVDAQAQKLILAAEAARVNDEQTARNVEGIKARAEALKEQNAELQRSINLSAQKAAAAAAAAAAEKKAAEEQERDQAKAVEEAAARKAAANQAQIDHMKNDLESFADESQSVFDELVSSLEAKFDEFEQQLIATQQANLQGVSDMITGVGDLSSLLSVKLAEDNKKAAMALFRTSQAAALAEVAMNTAVAISKVTAQTGIAAPIAIAGIATLGAAQAAAIAAQPPPVAHIGTGLAGSRDPLAPDERMRFGTRTLATEMSGPAGTINSTGSTLINDANNGRLQTSGGPMVAVIGRSHLDRELFRSGRRGTSRYARQLRTNPHPDPQRGY